MSLGAMAAASEALADALRQAAETRAGRLRWRRVVHAIDDAIDLCERVNLEASRAGKAKGRPAERPAPVLAVLLIARLRAERGRPAAPPATNQQALDELFRLQSTYLTECRRACRTGRRR